MARNIRIGVVGMRLGQWHIETIDALGGVDVVAIAENNPAGIGNNFSLTEYADSKGAKAYDDGVKMIEREELDAVSLCVSPQWRADLLTAAAAKGMPLLVEKPWATDLRHGLELAAIARDSAAPVMVEFPLRYMPPVERLKGLIDDGTLGVPYMAAADLQMSTVFHAGHWAWNPRNGNGLINESGCHILDTVAYLLGDPISLHAYGGNYTGVGEPPLEDAAAITINFASSAAASVSAGGLGARAIGTESWLNVYTEHGQALITGEQHMFDTIRWARRDDKEMQCEVHQLPPRRQIMRYSMQHFIECVRLGKQPTCGIDDGVRSVALADAVRRSLTESRPAAIEVAG